MNKTRLWIVLAALAVTALACNALSGVGMGQTPTSTPVAGGNVSEPNEEAPSNDPEPTADTGSGNGGSYNTEFPLPDNVSGFIEMGGDLITFQTTMSLEDLLAFYQDSLSKQGYKERKILTVTSDTTFNLVFDGHASGKAIVIQCVELGNLADGKVNVTIALQEID